MMKRQPVPKTPKGVIYISADLIDDSAKQAERKS